MGGQMCPILFEGKTYLEVSQMHCGCREGHKGECVRCSAIDTLDRMVAFVRAELAAERSRMADALKKALPKFTESDGWDKFFDEETEEEKREPCCPGDDIAFGWNKARAAVIAALEGTDVKGL